MPTRDFAGRPAENDPDPITFTVAGREFRCLPMVPPAAFSLLEQLPAIPTEDDAGYRTAVTRWVLVAVGFIRACLIDGDEARLDEVITTVPIDAEVYADLVAWLAGVYTARIQALPVPAQVPSPAVGEAAGDDDVLDPILARQVELNRDRWGPDADMSDGGALADFVRLGGGGIG